MQGENETYLILAKQQPVLSESGGAAVHVFIRSANHGTLWIQYKIYWSSLELTLSQRNFLMDCIVKHTLGELPTLPQYSLGASWISS